jgi:arylsulfatase A-like enzyme
MSIGSFSFLAHRSTEGVRLIQHLCGSNWTVPCIQSALSGQTTDELDMYFDQGNVQNISDFPEATYLAEVLEGQKWNTCLCAASHHFYSEDLGFGRDSGCTFLAEAGLMATQIVDETMNVFMGLSSEKPWYVHAHFYDPHAPYAPPEDYIPAEIVAIERLLPWDLRTEQGMFELEGDLPNLQSSEAELALAALWGLYMAEMAYTDAEIERLWAWLLDKDQDGMEDADGGWLGETLVVVWSDHGEQFLEHREFTHGQELFGEETETFVFFWGRDLLPNCWSGPTSHQDILPTVLSLLRIDIPEAVSGVKFGERPANGVFPAWFGMYGPNPPAVAVFDGESGLRAHYRWPSSDNESGEIWVVDTVGDPPETVNIFDPSDPIQQALLGLLFEEAGRLASASNGEVLPVNPDEFFSP